MADKDAESPKSSRWSGWLKAVLGTMAGLLSGAVVMYLSPLLDKVVKPAKPVANFAIDQQDLTVTFHNRSAGGSQGWWDFGDGSPLEPVSPREEIVTHTYANPGTYTAKLMLRNLIGEESERSVSVQLDNPHPLTPEILSIEVDAVSPGAYAPATFRVQSKTRNAELLIWNLSDDRPLEISMESPNQQERLVTFPKPGGYMIKLAAVAGRQAVERSEVVYVNEPPNGTVSVILNVADQATRVERVETTVPVSLAFPPDSKDAVLGIDRQIPARQGYEILEARLQPVNDPAARNLRVIVASDRRSAQLAGELVRQAGRSPARKPGPAPTVLARVQLIQERRTPVSRPPVSVTTTLTVPGSSLLSLPALPPGWVDPQRQLRLELRDGDRLVWQESQLPRGVPVQLQNRRCTLTALPYGNQVRVDLVTAKPAQQVTSN